MTCVLHGTRGVECGPECVRLTRAASGRAWYRFEGCRDGRYYWRREGTIPGRPGNEEIVSCSRAWFWRLEVAA